MPGLCSAHHPLGREAQVTARLNGRGSYDVGKSKLEAVFCDREERGHPTCSQGQRGVDFRMQGLQAEGKA